VPIHYRRSWFLNVNTSIRVSQGLVLRDDPDYQVRPLYVNHLFPWRSRNSQAWGITGDGTNIPVLSGDAVERFGIWELLPVRPNGGDRPVPELLGPFTNAEGQKKQPYFARTPAMYSLLEDTGLVPIVPSVEVPNLPLDEDYHGSKDFRWALFALLDDELAPQPFSPTLAWDEIDWNRFFEQTHFTPDEEQPGLIPIIPVPPPTLGWDDWDWSRDFSTARLGGPPEPEPFDFTPPIVPSLSWFDETQQIYGMAGLSALVVLDEFVNAPAGSIPFGPAPSGRSVRFGFSISSFR